MTKNRSLTVGNGFTGWRLWTNQTTLPIVHAAPMAAKSAHARRRAPVVLHAVYRQHRAAADPLTRNNQLLTSNFSRRPVQLTVSRIAPVANRTSATTTAAPKACRRPASWPP